MSEDRDLRERLRDLRVDPPDGGFAASLHRRLAAEPAPRAQGFLRPLLAPRWAFPTFGAVAASLLLFFAVTRRHEPATQLPATKVAVVRVNLSASVAVESAQIKVTLPDGLVFWADGQELAQRDFEWTQPLSAGDNDIPIAVRGVKPGRYRMTVSAQIGKEQVDDVVVLEVTGG